MGITITNSGQGSVVRFRNLGRGGLMTSRVVPPLLNQYSGALTAISLRKLNINYTGPAVRVRRSSDNAETNIGFVANALDTTSLLTFCGAGSGFVTTWYDQSGNARNFVQTTTANQPMIVNTGVTELVNGKPAIYFDGVNDSILSTFSSANSVTTIFDVFKINEPAAWVTHTLSGNYILAGNTINPAAADSIGYSARYKNSALTLTTTQTEVRAAYNTNTQILFTEIVASSTISSFGISTFGGEWHMLGHFQECILYGSDQSTNRTAIESNINSNYRIY